MRVIPTQIHAILDYLMGVVLIIVPLLVFGGGAEAWVPVVLGVALIVYSLGTNYEFAAVGVIPVPVHLGLDIVAGIVLIVSPWLFGFADEIWWLHVVLGAAEVAVALLTQTVPTSTPGRRPARET